MKTIEVLKSVRKGETQSLQKEAVDGCFHLIGENLFREQSVNLNYSIYKDRIKQIWQDVHRQHLFNGKGKNHFSTWVKWLINLKEDHVRILGEEDKRARDFILRHADVTNYNKIFSFRDSGISDTEAELFSIFLKREFKTSYFTLLSIYLQGPGIVCQPFWSLSMTINNNPTLNPSFFKEVSSNTYYVNHRLLGVGKTCSYENKDKKTTFPSTGKVELVPNHGARIIDPGGPAKLYEALLTPESAKNPPLTPERVVSLVDSENKILENQFSSLQKQLVVKWKEYQKKGEQKNITATGKHISLFIEYLDKIKKSSFVSLTNLNEVLVELLEFLKNPTQSKADKIQAQLIDFFSLVMREKQNYLIAQFKDINSSDLLEKFETINFAYLDKMILEPHSHESEILKIMETISTNFNSLIKVSSLDKIMEELDKIKEKIDKEADLSDEKITINFQELVLHWSTFIEKKGRLKATENEVPVINDIRLLMQEIEEIQNLPGLPIVETTTRIQEINQYLQNPTTVSGKKINEHVQFFFNLLYNKKLEGIVTTFLERSLPKKTFEKFKKLTLILDKLFHMPEAKHYNLIGILNDLSEKLPTLGLETKFEPKMLQPLSSSTEPKEGIFYCSLVKKIEEESEVKDEFGSIHCSIKSQDYFCISFKKNGEEIKDHFLKSEVPDENALLKLMIQHGHLPDNLNDYLDVTIAKLERIEGNIEKAKVMEQYKPLHDIILDCFSQCKRILTKELYTALANIESTFSKKDIKGYLNSIKVLLQSATTPNDLKIKICNNLKAKYPHAKSRPQFITDLLKSPPETRLASPSIFSDKRKPEPIRPESTQRPGYLPT